MAIRLPLYALFLLLCHPIARGQYQEASVAPVLVRMPYTEEMGRGFEASYRYVWSERQSVGATFSFQQVRVIHEGWVSGGRFRLTFPERASVLDVYFSQHFFPEKRTNFLASAGLSMAYLSSMEGHVEIGIDEEIKEDFRNRHAATAYLFSSGAITRSLSDRVSLYGCLSVRLPVGPQPAPLIFTYHSEGSVYSTSGTFGYSHNSMVAFALGLSYRL